MYQFKIEDIELAPKLEELKVNRMEENGNLTDNEVKNHNGVELPPSIPKEVESEVIEKEEV